MKQILSVLTFLAICSAQLSQLSTLGANYEYSNNLDVSNNNIVVFWTPKTDSVEFATACKISTGWCSLGFSSTVGSASMEGAFAVLSSTTTFYESIITKDGFGSFVDAPDGAVDGTMTRTTVGDYIVLEFERLLDTGNAQHQVLSLDTTEYFVAAMGTSAEPSIHSRRFGFSMTLSDGTGSTPVVLCDSSNCDSTGGTCVDGSCECNSGFQGLDCSEVVDTNKDVNPDDYTFSSTALSDRVTIYWNLPDDPTAAGALIEIAVEGETEGWVGIGFSESGSMIGSEAIIGWVPSSGGEDISAYNLGGKSTSAIETIDTIELTQTSVFSENGRTVIKFTRAMDSGDIPISQDGSTNIIFALGTTTSLSAHASGDREAVVIDFLSGEGQAVAADPRRLTHGVMMIIAWGVLLPIGALVGRHKPKGEGLKNWWPLHPALQAGSYFVTLIAFVLAITMVDTHFSSLHTICGLIITIFGFFQVVLGRFRPHQPKDYSPANAAHKKPSCIEAITCNAPGDYSSQRFLWENKHIWLGRILILFAFFTVTTGLLQIAADVGFVVFYLIFVALFLLAVIILEVRKCAE